MIRTIDEETPLFKYRGWLSNSVTEFCLENSVGGGLGVLSTINRTVLNTVRALLLAKERRRETIGRLLHPHPSQDQSFD